MMAREDTDAWDEEIMELLKKAQETGDYTELLGVLQQQMALLDSRTIALDSRITEHDRFIQSADQMFRPLNKAMAETFLSMVLKHNPINEEERVALNTVRQDPALASVKDLETALHAAEREILDGNLTGEEQTGYTGALITIRTELLRRGVPVEMRETEVREALDAADRAGREQVGGGES